MGIKTRNSVFSIFLLTIFSIQAIGFTVDIHYCKGEVQSISFFGKADSCSEMTDNTNKHKCCQKRQFRLDALDGIKSKKEPCCSNEMIHYESEGDFESEQEIINLSLDKSEIRSNNLELEFGTLCDDQIILHNTDPPLRVFDRQVLFQTFLI